MQEKQRKHGIVWFRNNLRVIDNNSLQEAMHSCDQVTAVYIFDPGQYATTPWGFPKTGGHRVRFLLETLTDLRRELAGLGIPLHFATGTPEEVLPSLIVQWQAEAIFTQKEWTTEEIKANQAIRKLTDVPFVEHYDQFLIHPDDLPFQTLDVPEVFTQFRKKVEAQWKVRPIAEVVGKAKPSGELKGLNPNVPVTAYPGMESCLPDPRTAFPFRGGSSQALERIDHYFWKTKKLQYYKRTRNQLLGTDYSSKLSPWLANGSISARMIYHEVRRFESEVISNEDTYWLLFELLWRDYFKYISLKHGDRLFQQGGIKQRKYDWKFDPGIFRSWTHGSTGDTFVDANMTELRKTGWMSNRGRQNTASFLAKHLLQDWRAGAAWFESNLVDYDVHSNWGNWNYVSGTGNDPRDRKFNTQSQAERYDPSGAFRKYWFQNTLF